MIKIFLDDLPKWENDKRYNGEFNWKECIGYKVKFIYEDIQGEVEIISYYRNSLILKYNNEETKISITSFKNGGLGAVLNKFTSRFKIEIGTIFKNNKRDLTITERKYTKFIHTSTGCPQNIKWYKYTCNKCGWTEGWIIEDALLRGAGCICCSPSPRTVVEGINDIPTTAPWMIPYFQGGYDEAKLYTKSSNHPIQLICPDCGKIKLNGTKSTLSHLYKTHSIGCSCGDKKPYPEKFMHALLQQLNVKFIHELNKTTFDWCKEFRYDFYIPSLNCIIETHGRQHYEETSGKWGLLSTVKWNDEYKKRMAKIHGIKDDNYIVIDCRKSEMEWIKNNILNSKLAKIFDLSKIDWNKCEEYALKNLVKTVCNYKKNNPDLSTTQISELLQINRSSLTKYFNKGAKLGWCNYNGRDEQVKFSGNHNNKGIEVYKDSILLKTFKSIAELIKQSEKLFGVRVYSTGITKVCTGKIKEYKGLIFKYLYKEVG